MQFNDYEKNIEKLESITKRLEEENLPLHESVALYEEGMKLHQELKKCLTETKGKVQRVNVEELSLEPWEEMPDEI